MCYAVSQPSMFANAVDKEQRLRPPRLTPLHGSQGEMKGCTSSAIGGRPQLPAVRLHTRVPVLPSNLSTFLRESGSAGSFLKDRPRDTEPSHLGKQRGSF